MIKHDETWWKNNRTSFEPIRCCSSPDLAGCKGILGEMLPTSARSLDGFLRQKHQLKHEKQPVEFQLFNFSVQAWVENGKVESCRVSMVNSKPTLFDTVDFHVLGVKDWGVTSSMLLKKIWKWIAKWIGSNGCKSIHLPWACFPTSKQQLCGDRVAPWCQGLLCHLSWCKGPWHDLQSTPEMVKSWLMTHDAWRKNDFTSTWPQKNGIPFSFFGVVIVLSILSSLFKFQNAQ